MDLFLAEPKYDLRVLIVGALYLCLFLAGSLILAIKLLEYRRQPFAFEPLTSALRRRSWTPFQVGIFLGLYMLLYLMAMFTGRFFYKEQLPLVSAVVGLLIWTAMLIAATVINRLRRETWQTGYGLGLRHLHLLSQSAIYYITSLAPVLFFSWLFGLLLWLLGQEPERQVAVQMMMEAPPLLRALLIGMALIGAPIFEEIVFRGILFPFILSRLERPGLATAITSVIFAAMHFHLPSFIALFVLSAALCFAYWRTGSLWVCIGMHALFNTISTLAILLVTA